MEIIRDRIRTKHFVGRAVSQTTMEDDFNVPDVKPDIEQMIEETGELKITEARANDGKIVIRGKLEFSVLYIGSSISRPMQKMCGSIPFEESMNMDGVTDKDDIKVSWDMEDLRTRMINSRKISVRSIVSFCVTASKTEEEEMAVDIKDGEDIYMLPKALDVSQIHSQKKDIVRIRREINVPATKPNIMEIIWDQVMIGSLDIKVLDGRVNVRGDFDVFIMYASQEGKNPLQYFNHPLDFDESVDCAGAAEEMIGNVEVKMIAREFNVKENEDGELRKIEAEIVLELNMAVYEEKHIKILADVYSNRKKLEPVMKEMIFDNILMKNQSVIKLAQKIKIKNDQAKILQICQSDASVKMDRMEIMKNGIMVEGVVYAQILYIAADDKKPVNAIKGTIPFSHMIEIDGMKPQCSFEMLPVLEQVSSTMADSEEIDIKAELYLNTIVFEQTRTEMLSDIKVSALDYEALEAMPGIVGYVVHPGDTLWKLAKQYYTTKERIMSVNRLDSETLSPRQKLVIVKEDQSIV